MNVLPIFLNDLKGRHCVVVGGNHEAERKALELATLEAAVTVIAPEVTPVLEAAAAEGRIVRVPRSYRLGDLKDAFLVIVAERDPVATAPIWEEARRERALINAMDDVPYCNFVSGSVVRRGPLVIAISTSGAAPALAVRIRERLEAEFGPEYGELLEMLGALRDRMARDHPDFDERRRRWYELVDSDLLDLIRTGSHDAAGKLVEGVLMRNS
jgi:precorrin-2 dehydrogenase / sirohydrochlorin ferrochelatase